MSSGLAPRRTVGPEKQLLLPFNPSRSCMTTLAVSYKYLEIHVHSHPKCVGEEICTTSICKRWLSTLAHNQDFHLAYCAVKFMLLQNDDRNDRNMSGFIDRSVTTSAVIFRWKSKRILRYISCMHSWQAISIGTHPSTVSTGNERTSLGA